MSLPTAMKAVAISRPGGPEVLTLEEIAVPQPKARELLVRVAAAGVNRPDVLQRQGNYPAPAGASEIPGLEIAGEVVAAGDGAERFKPGDRVTALVTGGGYAEYCVADERAALPFRPGSTPSRLRRCRKRFSPSGRTCSSAAG